MAAMQQGRASHRTEGDGTLNHAFSSFPMDKLPAPPGGKVVTIDSDMSMRRACRMLASHQILSAPLRDDKQADDAPWSRKYMGVVDFMSLVHWMMERTWGHAPAEFEELMQLREAFNTLPVGAMEVYDTLSRFVAVDPATHSLLDVALLLGKYNVHRVWLARTSGGDITNVITQSGLIKLVHANNHVFNGRFMSKSIGELKIGSFDRLLSVKTSDTYWDAFKLMVEHNVSALPVLDESGKLFNCISSHDLQYAVPNPHKFFALRMSIANCDIKTSRSSHLWTCKKEDSFASVLNKLSESNVHRLFVVDSDGRPTGVVSLCDMIAAMVKEPAVSKVASSLARP
jgi:5'-AMP-activated protein kinase regulatory gamma subunit